METLPTIYEQFRWSIANTDGKEAAFRASAVSIVTWELSVIAGQGSSSTAFALLAGGVVLAGRFLATVFRAPAQILLARLDAVSAELDRANKRLAEYEKGPKFEIAAMERATFLRLNMAPTKPDNSVDEEKVVRVLCVFVPLSLTNHGMPGSVSHWHVSLQFSDGQELEFHEVPLPGDELAFQSFEGVVSGRLSRADLMSERAAQTLNRGDSVRGYFFGAMGEMESPSDLPSDAVLRIQCSDFGSKDFGTRIPIGQLQSESILYHSPTLGTFRFRADSKGPTEVS